MNDFLTIGVQKKAWAVRIVQADPNMNAEQYGKDTTCPWSMEPLFRY